MIVSGKVLEGIAASGGIAIAKAFLLAKKDFDVPRKRVDDPAAETARFQDALQRSLAELEEIYEKTKRDLGEDKAQIFEAHMLVLQDPEYVNAVIGKIRNDKLNAEAALDEVSRQFVTMFEAMDNEYMRERAADIRDVTGRVLAHLLGVEYRSAAHLDEPVVLIAHDLTPSDTAQLDRRHVAGFATDIGGRTSHSAIMARSLEIPAVLGLKDVTAQVAPGMMVVVDGESGRIVIDPAPEELRRYEEKREALGKAKQKLQALVGEATRTADGRRVELAANIGTPADVEGALRNGAEGIGLFRSEFLYMNRNDLPDEEEQFAAYREAAEKMRGKPVIIRTLDIGGDKELPYLNLPQELNPFLGYRAIRLCLDRKDLFKTQLRAILRASDYGNVKMMYPMISTITEIRAANAILAEAKEELAQEGIPFDQDMEVGIMVEIPASALAADILAAEVDFFSIGTNDLIQYTLACDRMNEKISHLYQPYHPAILRLVKMVIDAAHAKGKWVGMCGEMAGDPLAVPVLLGLGLDEFSMSAASILPVRKLIRSLRYADVEELAREALNKESQEAVKAFLEERLGEVLR
ncbi:phosphoenolpyruvate--protein phosphotransferase [Bacillaceae bacterium]